MPSPHNIPIWEYVNRLLCAEAEPWHPLRRPPTTGPYLQRGRIDSGGSAGTGSLCRVLEPESPLLVADGEVPATGARVTRSRQLARTADGGVVLWVGRRKDAGPPRRSPGLRFDELTPAE